MFNGILAQSPFIIFKPGGVPNAITVTKWSDVQAFIALRQGSVTVYVDDSIAPAHVPAASGVTDCQGRVEIRPYRPDTNNFSNLTVDDGATLKSLARISGTIFLICDTRGAVPGLDFDYAPNVLGTPVPTFFIEDFAALGTAATCTQSPIVVPAANSLVLSFNTRGNIFMQSAAYLVTLAAATSNVTIAATDAEICGPGSPNSNLVTGPGGCTYQFDLPTSSPQLSAVPPVFTVGTLRKQLLDMSIQSVVFKPGVPSSGTSVATWAEVQDFIATRNGQVIVYVDASVAAANVPAASGVTDCLGRVEIRPYRQDSNNFTTLTVDSGATLKSLYRLAGTIFLQLDTQGAVPALDFDYTGAAFPTLYVEDQASIGTSTTATQPACVIPAGQELNWWVTNGAEVIAQTASAIVQVLAGATFGVFARNANFVSTAGSIPATWAQGPGRFTMGYDANTARESNTPGTVLGPGINFTNVATSITVAIDGDPNVLGSTTQTVYVSKSGSDVNGNGSRSFPYLTIQKALTSITDATVNKRYNIEVGVGEYADPFLMKPWVGISGTKQTSGFYGLTEITALADTVGYDPVAYGPAGFSVAWLSHLVFSNHQTWNQTTAGNQRVQLTCFDVNFNGGFSFIGDGTGGVDNYTLDDCLVYGGGLAQGIQFLFTIGGTEFQGGTVTIQAAPNAAAAESTTWLAQNTAVGATFNPTAVHVLWAAPTPPARQAKLDWNNTNAVGQINLDGANVVANIAGVRPANIIQSNGAPAATVQPITIEMIFTAGVANALAALQAAGTLPKTGTLPVLVEGYGGGGGSGGGQGGAAGAPGQGGGGGGGAHYCVAHIDVNLANGIDVNIGAGGSAGAAGAAGAAGGNGGDGGDTNISDHFVGSPLLGFIGAQGGNGGGSVLPFTPGGGGINFHGPSPRGVTATVAAAGLEGCGGAGGLGGANGTNGNPAFVGLNNLAIISGGGGGGLSAAGEGGGGGGGGGGPQHNGANGANGTAANGNPGNAGTANAGNGAGGGSGGAGAGNTGGAGAVGGSGWLKLTFTVQ